MHSNWWLKLILISVMGIVILIPLAKITSLIAEREFRQREAEAEVRHLWGGEQVLSGPVLRVPFERAIPVAKEDRSSSTESAGETRPAESSEKRGFFFRTEYFYLLPESLAIDVDIEPQVRQRGSFEVVVYTARLAMNGRFDMPAEDRLPSAAAEIRWQDACLIFDLSELRGLRQNPRLVWQGQELEIEPRPGVLLSESIVVPKLDASGLLAGGASDVELTLALSGSGSLQFLPFGRETEVTISSVWPNPSFRGAALPITHEVGDEGFSARWTVPFFARGFPQAWTAVSAIGDEQRQAMLASGFGVELLLPVDFYQLVSRCTKYAVLFLGFTFGVFFLFELLSGLRIHAMQYLMVGFAMSLFYLLLLAIAEHVGFSVAYLAAAVGTVALISGYCVRVLATRGRALLLMVLLGGLYVLLYVLVQLQTYALLVGSLGLFLALALAMYLTRHVDWYELGRNKVAWRGPTGDDHMDPEEGAALAPSL